MFESAPSVDPTEVDNIAAHIKGPADAEYTLVEFSDFQCEACEKALSFVATVMGIYPDQLNLEYRHLPLRYIHKNADIAARASEAAGLQGKFWEMHDKLFEMQSAWGNSVAPKSLFVDYAVELGMDAELFRADLENHTIIHHIDAHYVQARDLAVTGTPTFFLVSEKNGIELGDMKITSGKDLEEILK